MILLGDLLSARNCHHARLADKILRLEEEQHKKSSHTDRDKAKYKRAPDPFSGDRFAMFEWRLTEYMSDIFGEGWRTQLRAFR